MKTEEGKMLPRASYCHRVDHCSATRKEEIKSQYCPVDEAKAVTEGGIKDEPYFVEMWRWKGKSIQNRENEVTPYNLRELGKALKSSRTFGTEEESPGTSCSSG